MTTFRRHNDRPDPPMRRREDALEEMLQHGSENFRRYRRGAYFAFAFVIALAVAGLAWTWSLVQSIQDERARNVMEACREQNARHDATVQALDSRLEVFTRGASPREREQLRTSRDFTVALIDALAPRQDCAELTRSRVSGRD